MSARHPIRWLPVLLIALLLGACAGGEETPPSLTPETSRSYAMGFTDFPYANSSAAVDEVWDILGRDADLVVYHLDDGIPWQEALDAFTQGISHTETYDAGYLAALDFKASRRPAGHVVYLAITPLAFLRDGLAAHRGAAGNEPLTPPWDGYALDAPEVITAFAAHCENLIARFEPDYFAYAIEANILADAAPEKWDAFVNLASVVYASLKANHPDLPVFITLQASFFHGNPTEQAAAIAQILPYTDMIAVSAYPYTDDSDPANLPADFFSAVADLAPDKPFAIAETAWPAEDVMNAADTVLYIPASPDTQAAYLQRLLADADRLSARFINWFLARDYDAFWESTFKDLPEADLVRLWRDTGLYDGDGNQRPALKVWRDRLASRRAGN